MLHEIMTVLLNKAKLWLIQPARKSCNHATQSATYAPVCCKLFPLRSLYTVQGHKHSKSVVASTNRQRVQSQRSVFAYYYPFLGTRVMNVGQYTGNSTTFTKQNTNITYCNKLHETGLPSPHTRSCVQLLSTPIGPNLCRLVSVPPRPYFSTFSISF